MNWSMITCAPLTKSPNCASQRTSACGTVDRVAVLEAEGGSLGERRVVHLEGRARGSEVLDRRVLLAGHEVVEDEVAVREGAALGVLAGHAHGRAVRQQRPEREGLGLGPVDAALLARARRGGAPAPSQLGVNREAVGDLEQAVVQLAKLVGGHGGVDLRVGAATDLRSLRPAALAERGPELARARRASAPAPRPAAAATSASLTTPASASSRAYSSRTVGCSSIRSYMSGCV